MDVKLKNTFVREICPIFDSSFEKMLSKLGITFFETHMPSYRSWRNERRLRPFSETRMIHGFGFRMTQDEYSINTFNKLIHNIKVGIVGGEPVEINDLVYDAFCKSIDAHRNNIIKLFFAHSIYKNDLLDDDYPLKLAKSISTFINKIKNNLENKKIGYIDYLKMEFDLDKYMTMHITLIFNYNFY